MQATNEKHDRKKNNKSSLFCPTKNRKYFHKFCCKTSYFCAEKILDHHNLAIFPERLKNIINGPLCHKGNLFFFARKVNLGKKLEKSYARANLSPRRDYRLGLTNPHSKAGTSLVTLSVR